jgi:hypothetical protein
MSEIVRNEKAIEHIGHGNGFSIEAMVSSNYYNMEMFLQYGLDYILIDNKYDVDY